MAFLNMLPFPIGYRDAGAYRRLLGQAYVINDKWYRVVQAGAAFAAGSGGLFVVTAFSSGVPSWVVTVNGTANNPKVCGIIPALDENGTTVNTAVFVSGDIFLIQIHGPAQVQVASSNVIDTAANTAALRADTNGLAALVASSIEGGGGALQGVGYATNTTAATSGTLRTVMLEGLL